eukprot:14039207-Ditylum_brightwellii.AAC.1
MPCNLDKGCGVDLGAFIGVAVGLTLESPLGGIVVLMPWNGQATCGLGIGSTLGATWVCTIWQCSVCGGVCTADDGASTVGGRVNCCSISDGGTGFLRGSSA